MPKIKSSRNYILDLKGIFVLLLSFLASTSIIALVTDFALKKLQTDLSTNMLFNLIAYLFMFLIPIFCFEFFVLKPKFQKLNFNFKTKPFSTYILIFFMMFGMMFINEFVTSLIPKTGEYLGPLYRKFERQFNFLKQDKAAIIIYVVLFAPLIEEIIFRGIIQKGLINKGVKPWKAILMAAIVFGLVHGNPWQFVGAVLLGSVLGLVYYKTKSLLLPILLHAFNNLCSAMLIFYADTESFAETFKISEWMILGIGIILFSVFCYLFLNKYKVHYSE